MATVADVSYLDHLQRRNYEAIGFFPRGALERNVLLGRIVLASVNGEPAGYLFHGPFLPTARIYQACIEYDLRGQLYGAALVRWFVALAEAAAVMTVSLRCACDVDANGFWSRMGFVCEAVVPGGKRRARDINVWRRYIVKPLFILPVTPSRPSRRLLSPCSAVEVR